jgi:CheY-like chemotaxis protein
MEQKISDKSINEIVVKDKTLDITPFDASGHRVLIVDDNKLNLKVAEKMFSEYNLELDLVGTGMECIEKIKSGEKYDLVFLDILMPKMKGPEVLEKLKRIPSFKVPVIALTADVISGMEDEYIEQGFDNCMSKPIIAEELYYVLKKYFKSTEVNFDNNLMQDSYNESLLESVGVNVKLGIDLTGNIDNYRSAVEDFYNNLEDKINLLFDFKISNDLEKYGSCAKELKNLANRIGYNSFANIVQDHEQAANEKNTEFIIKNYIKLKMESNKVKDLLKKYLGK